MRILAGLDEPDLGKRTVSASNPPRIAMVFQESRLIPWLTIFDNLLFAAGAAARPRASELLHLVELGDSGDLYPGQLSGGMQRRVALARALLIEPSLLLLDEPLNSLDPALEDRMSQVLCAYWQQQRSSIVMVTHDPRQSARLASRVIGLTTGQPGLTLDERLIAPPPGNRSDGDEEIILRRLIKACPGLSVAS
jgi:ABC-type nitrate/sulfonate/bicarbonate transport system ATPase subunit